MDWIRTGKWLGLLLEDLFNSSSPTTQPWADPQRWPEAFIARYPPGGEP